MDRQLQEYYESRFDMFATQGWKDLMDDVRDMLKATDRISAAKDNEDFLFKKGEVSMMNWLLSIQSVSEETYEELKRYAETDS